MEKKAACDSCNRETNEYFEVKWGSVWVEICADCKEKLKKMNEESEKKYKQREQEMNLRRTKPKKKRSDNGTNLV